MHGYVRRHSQLDINGEICDMTNVTKVMNLRRMMGQTRLGLSNNKFIPKHILSSKSMLTNHFSDGHNFSYI